MKRKLISAALALSMVLSFASPAAARMGEVEDHFYTLKYSDRYNDLTLYYHIPEIIMGNMADLTLSEDIYDFYNDLYTTDKALIKKNIQPKTGGITYICGQNNEIFSLVVKRMYQLYDDYILEVYNMDKNTGCELTDHEVLESFGYTYTSFHKRLRQILPDIFDKLNRDAYGASDEFSIQYALEYTLSDDALDWARPYVNDNGELCCIAWVGSLVGSGSYMRTINLEDGTHEGDIQYPKKQISSYDIASPRTEISPGNGYRPHGDVNGDGKVDAKDATQILRYINGKSSVFDNKDADDYLQTLDVADVYRDFNGRIVIDAKDATQILRYINGKSSIFDTIA